MFEKRIRGVILISMALPATLLGVVFSPVLISWGLILLCVGLVVELRPPRFSHTWRRNLPRVLRSSLFWGLAGLYLWLLFGVWQTYDWAYYLDRLRIKLPLLLLPVAWAGVASDDRANKFFRQLAYVFCGFISLILCAVLVNYALHFSAINQLIEVGKAVPVPRGNHVRFSMLVALAAAVALHHFLRYRQWPYLVLAIFSFAGLHFLAVRTGLVLAYAGWGVLLLGAGRGCPVRWKIAGLVGLCLLPLLAYLSVPSLRTKLDYTRWELFHRPADADDGGQYSDRGRLLSIRLGLEVWREHPWVGVGPGNLAAAMREAYARRAPEVPVMRPHNQFVSALAGGGLVGGGITVACFLLIGLGGRRYRRPLFLAVWAMLTLSCMVENTLETSVGVTVFTLALLLTAYPPLRKPG